MAFNFKSVGHFFASAAHDAKVIATFLQVHQPQINKVAETGAAVISIADPALAPLATVIERAAEAALGEVLAVVSKLTDAEAAKGANVALDAAAIAEFKTLLASMEKLNPGTLAAATAVK